MQRNAAALHPREQRHQLVDGRPGRIEIDVERAVAVAGVAEEPEHVVEHLEPCRMQVEDRALPRLRDPTIGRHQSLLGVLLLSEAEIFLWGANYDQSVTWPALFRDEIAPWLGNVSARTHAAGKLLLTHADGENHALLSMFPGCGIDVAESVCTRPMVRHSLAELRAGFGPAATVWGGIPSVALLPDVMDDRAFEGFLDETFAELGTGERLILGVSDNVPPEADLARLERIGERVRAFGPVRPIE